MADMMSIGPVADEIDLSHPAVGHLVQAAGLPAVEQWTPVLGGANNRIYYGTTDQGRILLKLYFNGAGDERDRLRGEYCFYHLAEKAEPGSVPKVWGWDMKNRLGLFGFVEGRKLEVAEVDARHIRAAGQLVASVNNALTNMPLAGDFPNASEACFSFAEHFGLVQARVERLHSLSIRDGLDEEAQAWIRDELTPTWHQIRAEATLHVCEKGFDVTAVLPLDQRWISPSDFGFHNALLNNKGAVKFFDFEYAGWDDPAKLLADFFCQPSVAVPLAMWDEFIGALSAWCRWQPEIGRRAEFLLPVYRIKWCCILMNEFLPSGAQRRCFSKINTKARRAQQLRKARAMLEDALCAGNFVK